jgi:hypothetical protein
VGERRRFWLPGEPHNCGPNDNQNVPIPTYERRVIDVELIAIHPK